MVTEEETDGVEMKSVGRSSTIRAPFDWHPYIAENICSIEIVYNCNRVKDVVRQTYWQGESRCHRGIEK